MRNYLVVGPVVTLRAGVVKISDKLAGERMHALKAIEGKKGCYLINGEAHFKRGLEFAYDGELPKAMAAEVELKKGGRKSAEEEAAAKAAADAAAKEAEDKEAADEAARNAGGAQ